VNPKRVIVVSPNNEERILHGWFTESDESGAYVVGLTECEDGSFETIHHNNLRLCNPTVVS
jgi:hypothetical protein